MVRVRLVVERRHLPVASRPVQAYRLAQRPVGFQPQYPDAVRGLVQLVRAEGLSKLTLGMGPNVAKGVFLNVGQ